MLTEVDGAALSRVGGLPWRSRAFVAALVIAIAAYCFLAVGLAHNRKPWNDEAMSASAGDTLATHGYLAIPSFDENDPAMRGIHHKMYYILPLQMLVMAAWYKIVGFSLFTTRVLSMLWTIVFFCALYRLVKILSSNAMVALLAVALTACDYQIVSAAALGRYDTMVAALGFSAYALFLEFRERRFTLAVVGANILVAAAAMTHPNALIYFVGLWFLILWYDRRRIRFHHVALAALPYLLGAGAWGLYILEDVPAFKSQFFGNTGHRVGLFHPFAAFVEEFRFRYGWAYGLGPQNTGHATPFVRLKAIALLGYLAGVIGALATPTIRRNPGVRVLLMLTGIHFLYFTFYEGMKFNYYLVHMLPFYLSLLAVVVYYLWKLRPALRLAAAAAVALIIAAGVGGAMMRIHVNDMGRTYDPAVAFVKEHAGPNDLIFASCSFGFGYGFRPNLVDDGTFGYYSGWRPRFIVMEEIYDDYVKLHQRTQPKMDAHYQKLIADYRVVYDNGAYRVLERATPN